jgi:hypothetical protein
MKLKVDIAVGALVSREVRKTSVGQRRELPSVSVMYRPRSCRNCIG